MNNTKPSHNQFFKKPVYTAMTLLSFLGDKFLASNNTIFTKSNNEICFLKVFVNDTATSVVKETSFIEIAAPNDSKYVIYVIDNEFVNPYKVWTKAGSPVYPDFELRRKIRNVEVFLL